MAREEKERDVNIVMDQRKRSLGNSMNDLVTYRDVGVSFAYQVYGVVSTPPLCNVRTPSW